MKKIIWRTKQGEEIPIREMSDGHLINTIRYLKRTAPLQLQKEINKAWGFAATLSGEMAQYAMDQEIDTLQEINPEDFLEDMPIYQSLVREAKRRKLKYE